MDNNTRTTTNQGPPRKRTFLIETTETNHHNSNNSEEDKPIRKRKQPKRHLPPHMIQLYQQLQDNDTYTSAMQQEHAKAQELLQEARRRLEAAQQQLTALAQEKVDLEERVLREELSLDSDFTHHYRQLLKFRHDYGHCNIPSQENHQLAEWAKKMRRVRTLWQAGQHYQGPPWKFYLRALDRVGFVWDAVHDKWQTQFDKLMAFRSRTGHTRVPKAYPPDPSLGAWVHRQRYHYKLYHEGKPTQLTLERIQLLQSAGFSWTGNNTTNSNSSNVDPPIPTRPKRGTPKRTAEQEWEHHFQQLLRFQREYGHVKVSAVGDQNRNNQLRDWVAWQRREYKRWKRGEPSHVTSEHVRQLEAIGFQWHIRGNSNSTTTPSDPLEPTPTPNTTTTNGNDPHERIIEPVMVVGNPQGGTLGMMQGHVDLRNPNIHHPNTQRILGESDS
jgi:Helicase associated domain